MVFFYFLSWVSVVRGKFNLDITLFSKPIISQCIYPTTAQSNMIGQEHAY